MDLKQIPFLDLTVSDENEFDIHINSLKDILQNGPLISGNSSKIRTKDIFIL